MKKANKASMCSVSVEEDFEEGQSAATKGREDLFRSSEPSQLQTPRAMAHEVSRLGLYGEKATILPACEKVRIF